MLIDLSGNMEPIAVSGAFLDALPDLKSLTLGSEFVWKGNGGDSGSAAGLMQLVADHDFIESIADAGSSPFSGLLELTVNMPMGFDWPLRSFPGAATLRKLYADFLHPLAISKLTGMLTLEELHAHTVILAADEAPMETNAVPCGKLFPQRS
ncbi:hypothetical protein GGF32_001419 [Allomyces javanicus]|nr:hypothetical protein GGF32_001419 [Allomyces javanicus]